jgi:hypothetical protein
VAEVGGPPVLRVGHQGVEILDEGVQVELLEGFGVVEVRAHRVGLGGVLVEDADLQLVGPPVGIRRGACNGVLADIARERAFGFGGHGDLLGVL